MKLPNNRSEPFEVFYDSHCPMCKSEIEMIRRKDKRLQMKLTDISAVDFDAAQTGRTLDELMREIHGRYADGSVIVGVEVFREIYSRLGFGFLVKPTRWAIVRWTMDVAYRLFASIRYRAALKRFNKGSCELPVAAFPNSIVSNTELSQDRCLSSPQLDTPSGSSELKRKIVTSSRFGDSHD